MVCDSSPTVEAMYEAAVRLVDSNPAAQHPFRVFALGLIGAGGIDRLPSELREKLPWVIEHGVVTQEEIDAQQKYFRDYAAPRNQLNLIYYCGLHGVDKEALAHGVVTGALTHREIVEEQKTYRRRFC